MNTVSAPAGMAAPVKIRMAWPGLSAISARAPAVSRPAIGKLAVAIGAQIGMAHGIAVDRRIIERRQIDRRLDVGGGDAAARAAQRHPLGLGHRRDALADQPLHVLERQQRTGKRETVVGQLRHQPLTSSPARSAPRA